MREIRARNLIPTDTKCSQRKKLFFILQRYVSVETCSNGLSISKSLRVVSCKVIMEHCQAA